MRHVLMNWLSGKNSKRATPRTRASVRPTLESLEERATPTAVTWLGNYTAPGGYWAAGTQKVSFFIGEVQGSFTYANAQQAWSQGMAIVANSRQTLSTNAEVLDRTTSQHFLLIGWENLTTHVGGWLAAKYDTSYSQLVTSGPWWNQHTSTVWHSTMDWMSNDGQSQHNVEGPLTLNYTTNGYHLGLYVSPDSSGNIHSSFNPPY